MEIKKHEVPKLEGGEEVDGEAATAGQCLAVLEKEEWGRKYFLQTNEREDLLRRLEDEKKKATTSKKRNKLQEDCMRMMTRLIEDWGSEKCQEEEETFNGLEEAELQLCAASVMQMTDDYILSLQIFCFHFIYILSLQIF